MTRQVRLPANTGLRADGTLPGGWWHDDPEGHGRIVCDLCPRACRLRPGDRGFCFVRQNLDDEMVLTTYGRSTGFCIDPIEKKPLNHFYPGTSVLSFGTAGCNLGCKFCQNWDISKSREIERLSAIATPEAIAEAARRLECRSVAFTYNDPVIWAEYAIATARACRAVGVKAVAVTAGYITPEARGAFFEVMDAANVDLKGFTEEFYHHITSSHLAPVLDTIAWLKRETDVWFELTNLMIPGANDDMDDVRRMCDWILGHCGDTVPVHFTAFHPDFRMLDRPHTPHATLLEAHETALRAGLKHVYTGNVDDLTHQSTYCPHCSRLLIERNSYVLGAYHLDGDRCGHCGGPIAGRFDPRPGSWGRRRVPVEISRFARQCEPGPPEVHEIKLGCDIKSKLVNNEHDKKSPAPEVTTPGPGLTDEQRRRVLQAASEFVAAAVRGRAVTLADLTLAGVSERSVMGAYVTLKRQGHLRACCGTLGRPRRLLDALHHAAFVTATEDHRLPPISATELPYLDLHVNLLHGLEEMSARGRDRAGAVRVGRHGLWLRRGEVSGLLLPGVAVEHDWDPEEFLRHTCRKAGLPLSAWEEEETRIITFESIAFGDTFDASVLAGEDTAPALPLAPEQLPELARHARDNLGALARGMAPGYYLFGVPDGNVAGLALSVAIGDGPPRWHATELSTRPGLPLQATLLRLCEQAAAMLRARGVPFESVRVGVSVLSDPALHGSLAAPDLRGLDPSRRALVAVENGRTVWTYAPERPADDLLAALRREVRGFDPEAATLLSLAAQSTESEIFIRSTPQPVVDLGPRSPAVAGRFYPADPAELGRLVDALLGASAREPARWAAAMVPHAGLVYSGQLAAAVLNRIKIPGRVIILGPKHTPLGVNWAVAPHESWSIPGASVAADPELARALAASIPGLELDAAAHRREHAIEVELPFLARLAPSVRVVGLAIGAAGASWERCRRFAQALARVIRGLDEPPLLLISSDMNHFASDAETRRLDEIALDALERLDPAHLLATVNEHQISMCGVLPAVIAMETLRQLGGLRRCERVGHTTSADVTGDTSRVVGYAGVLLD